MRTLHGSFYPLSPTSWIFENCKEISKILLFCVKIITYTKNYSNILKILLFVWKNLISNDILSIRSYY